MKLVRYRDLIIEQKSQQNDRDPLASGRCLRSPDGKRIAATTDWATFRRRA